MMSEYKPADIIRQAKAKAEKALLTLLHAVIAQ